MRTADGAGPAAADLLPKTAVSQEARDELNAKTSNLPTLKETAQNAADALTGGRDVAGDVKKARADGLERVWPSLVFRA